ncbi:MAG: hypothetical protein WCK95_09305 [Alphaproteobacteria bacterium]|jgi:hypothetical protein
MTVADNLLTLQAEEDRIRSISLAHIRQHEDLGLHADAIEAAMSVIEHFTAGWLTADLDELTIQHLGIRLFNAAASAWRLLLCGYYQNSTAQLRDLLETAFLLDYLGTAPGLVATWRDARSAADRDQFRPVKIRESLDTRDGFKERKRADHYRLLSTYASHPNPLGFAMLRPAGTTLAKVGPFFDESALKAVLEEAGKAVLPAAVNYVPYFELRTPTDMETRHHFYAVADRWFRAGYGIAPSDGKNRPTPSNIGRI